MSFKLKFWGVRGSIACPGPRHMIYGGNTSCIEVAMGGRRIIFDAGTGIRNLGTWFLRKGGERATILLSHTHWDHINGFPFFAPAFVPGTEFRVMAGHLTHGLKIENVLAGQMTHPFFPVPIEVMHARLVFEDFSAGDDLRLAPDIRVRTAVLNHPDRATAYRVEYGGKALCYVTDTEHTPGSLDETVLALIEGADLVIYDCTYTDAEFPEKVGWGHSTWQEGVRLARAAGAKKLAIFHHDPEHDDPIMTQIEREARQMWEGAFVAREDMRLLLA
ncbi:MAG: MBL fold metallo-hydrolase [Alphaproteobacteria bacterium]|nr:MBL fold metallo-hydrolase [Alphaproteobacteria bacterium]